MRSSGIRWISLIFVLMLGQGGPVRSQVREQESGFVVRRGTNISHWLSQSRRRGEERRAWFTRKDVEFIASLGFDHIRIPVDEEQLWHEDGTADEEAMSLLQQALDWCAEFNLRAIVDLHILRSHHFNAAEKPLWTQPAAQERFLDCWRDLSRRLRPRPTDQVAYELMNEPVAEDPADWNRLLARAVQTVRAEEPMRVLVIGSNRWQSVETFDRLEVPPNDPHILLSFHFYEPFALTHYRAGWTKAGEYQGPVRYPGVVVADADFKSLPKALADAVRGSNRYFDRRVLEGMLRKPLAVRDRTGLPLYCGEWGALPSVPREDRLRWYQDMRSMLEDNGIGWATWDYKGGFGLVDRDGRPDTELIQILTQ
jgi:endoglucanase